MINIDSKLHLHRSLPCPVHSLRPLRSIILSVLNTSSISNHPCYRIFGTVKLVSSSWPAMRVAPLAAPIVTVPTSGLFQLLPSMNHEDLLDRQLVMSNCLRYRILGDFKRAVLPDRSCSCRL
uniref:Uncharacterized protein n=1 Tax=Panagrellus redivivus TaxID=6233 RepID=A0A7E4UNN5_PANRE